MSCMEAPPLARQGLPKNPCKKRSTMRAAKLSTTAAIIETMKKRTKEIIYGGFLPIIAIVVIVKFAVLLAVGVAFGAVILAILIPLAILFLIFVGPILLISALT